MSKKVFKGGTLLNPVPVVLITSENKDGKVNVFTAAWVGTVCTKPPMLTVSIRPERLSYDFIKESKKFVVNLPTTKMVKEVDFCGVRSGKIIDKIKTCNFTIEKTDNLNAPAISECPVSIECDLKSITPLGSHDLFLAEITSVNVDENLIDNKGKFHFEKADLMCYCHGEYFPMKSKPIGKFGFSVQKKNKKNKRAK